MSSSIIKSIVNNHVSGKISHEQKEKLLSEDKKDDPMYHWPVYGELLHSGFRYSPEVVEKAHAFLQLQRGNLFKLQMEVNECDSRRLRF